MQDRLIAALQSVLADKEGASVLGGIQRLKLLLVDSGDVADDMGGQVLVGVVPHHPGTDFGALEPGQLDREPCHFGFAEPESQGDAFVLLALGLEGLEVGDILVTQRNERPDVLQQLVEVLNLFRGDFKAVGDVVFSERFTISIKNGTPIGRNGGDLDLVFPGQGGVFLMTCHLKIEKPDQEEPCTQQHEDQAGDQAVQEEPALSGAVIDGQRIAHEGFPGGSIQSRTARSKGQMRAPVRLGYQ